MITNAKPAVTAWAAIGPKAGGSLLRGGSTRPARAGSPIQPSASDAMVIQLAGRDVGVESPYHPVRRSGRRAARGRQLP